MFMVVPDREIAQVVNARWRAVEQLLEIIQINRTRINAADRHPIIFRDTSVAFEAQMALGHAQRRTEPGIRDRGKQTADDPKEVGDEREDASQEARRSVRRCARCGLSRDVGAISDRPQWVGERAPG